MKITFLGDVLCDYLMSCTLDNYRDIATDKFNFNSVFAHVTEFLKASDYVMANLETPISHNNDDLTNKKWEFCSPFEFAEALKKCGVNYVSTANNHCLDRGISGIESTINSLDEIGLDHSGTYISGCGRKPLIVSIDGLRIGILSYTYGTNAVCNHQYLDLKNRCIVNLLQEQEGSVDRINPLKRYVMRRPNGRVERFSNLIETKIFPENVGKQWFEKTTLGGYRRHLIKRDLKYLKRNNVDITVMHLHIGGQYNTKPSELTQRTIQWLLKKNCNIIIGNHEHVIHGNICKINSNQIATYSIGNFLASTGIYEEPYNRRSEYSIALHIYIDPITKKMDTASFSVLKTIASSEKKLEVWPVTDLLHFLPAYERKKTIEEALLAAKDFSGKEFIDLEKEFILSE